MDLQHLFQRQNKQEDKMKPREDIDIEQNSESIIYKYYGGIENRKVRPQETDQQKNHTQLSKIAISPCDRSKYQKEHKFQKYRSQENILYQFQNYLVYKKLLGQGSFSKVYLGEIKKTRRLVAIKEVQKLQENQIACLMNSQSPNIIKLHSFWNLNKHSYIALQLCDQNLRQILLKISVQQKIQYFEQIVEGMNYLNKKNIIHRDLKFQNILLKGGIIKISDFGFAKPIGSKLAVFSEKCGTPYTMAPQIYFHNGQGKPVYSHKCDIYSLGVILHEMLYQVHPFGYCAMKMKNNIRLNVKKKFGYLDVLIERCLEQQVTKRCNWNQFMQVFTLYKIKKSHQHVQVLKERNRILPEPKIVQKRNRLNHNLLKYKRNIYQTPQKHKMINKQNEKQNPFKKIDIPVHQRNDKPQKQEKGVPKYDKSPDKSSLIDKLQKKQDWKNQQEQIMGPDVQKKNRLQNDAVSVVKLVALVMMILLLITLAQKQFQ